MIINSMRISHRIKNDGEGGLLMGSNLNLFLYCSLLRLSTQQLQQTNYPLFGLRHCNAVSPGWKKMNKPSVLWLGY